MMTSRDMASPASFQEENDPITLNTPPVQEERTLGSNGDDALPPARPEPKDTQETITAPKQETSFTKQELSLFSSTFDVHVDNLSIAAAKEYLREYDFEPESEGDDLSPDSRALSGATARLRGLAGRNGNEIDAWHGGIRIGCRLPGRMTDGRTAEEIEMYRKRLDRIH